MKKFEKFVNKKNSINSNNSNSINKSNLNINFYGNYKFSQTTNIYSNNYITKSTKHRANIKNNTFKTNPYLNSMQNKLKFKLLPGMFSYKRNIHRKHSLSNSYDSKNTNRNNSSQISNKLYINNQNHLIPNLKLLIDNTETSSLRTLSNNDNISYHFPSYSSINLNKYRITNDMNNKNKSVDMGNAFNNVNDNYNFVKYNNIIVNNLQQPRIKNSKEKVHMNSKKAHNHSDSGNYNNNIDNIVKIKNNFIGKTKGENESRRMIIELLKVLKQKENNNDKINNILKLNNISYRVLNQQTDFSKIINYSNNSLSNSYVSQYSKKIEMPKKTANIKNINKFLNDMNDITNDKIKMINFLSIPRIMELIFMEKKYKFIFYLVPNQLSYKKGIESYIYQWLDIKKRKTIGGFDLIKVNSCCIKYQNDKNVLIETFDGVVHRQYELITSSNDIASYYVKSINYLSRLEKCKIYNKKYLCDY